MDYNLIVEGYGKIDRADIRVRPFTLFVGDNNSGKSYLLSLIWGLRTISHNSVLFDGMLTTNNQICKKVLETLRNAVEMVLKDKEPEITFRLRDFLELLNDLLDRNKEKFVSSIFNYRDIEIRRLNIQIEEDWEMKVSGSYGSRNMRVFTVYGKGENIICRVGFSENITEEFIVKTLAENIIRWILKDDKSGWNDGVVYFPAARTGFVLAKDAINKTGRQKVYDLIAEGEEIEQKEIQPFTKPIIHFLNSLEDLTLDYKDEDRGTLVKWIEDNMASGIVEYEEAGTREMRYRPDGAARSLPMRISSAVITELAPLILLLKHKKFLNMICYEEPEMCLHPKLQLEMGRLLIRMVNRGIFVVATTHSDIILQHVNNMMKAYVKRGAEEFLQLLDITEEDCLSKEKVAVYQFTDTGISSIVEELKPGKDGFVIPTFTHALMDIFKKTATIGDCDINLGESDD